MANTKSAQKRARQSIVRKQRNLSKKTAIKTAFKKVDLALNEGNIEQAKVLFKDAESKIARAAGKGIVHRKTAQRKTSRLAQRIRTSEQK